MASHLKFVTWIWFFLGLASSAWAQQTKWLEVELESVGVASEDILNKAIERAYSEGFSGILLKIDCPGGSLTSTKAMVKSILASKIPIIAWVGPSGSSATSAAAILALSTPIIAMAPGTIIGAATPVQSTGKNIEGGKDDNSDMHRKVLNDTSAFVETLAKTRGRNVELAKSFVTNAASITDDEALAQKISDLTASNRKELMEKLNRRSIKLNERDTVVLHTDNIEWTTHEPSLRQILLSIVSNPNLFYLFYIAGLIGLGFELTHPGVIFPGVAGAICMILALIGTSVLPVSYGAAGLVLAGVVMMFAEIYVASLGALGIGGFIAFVIGSIFLVDPNGIDGLQVSILKTILPMSLFILAFIFLVVRAVYKAMQSKVLSGEKLLLAAKGTVLSDFVKGKGQVKVTGEIWAASTLDGSSPLQGSDIVVISQNNLELVVKTLQVD